MKITHNRIVRAIAIMLVICMFMGQNYVYATTTDNTTLANNSTEQIAETNEPLYFDEVPLYLQTDYPKTPYGNYGTIASHGCGVACLAMVASYLTDTEYSVPDLAKQFGRYNTHKGSEWVLFEDSAEVLNLPLQERVYKWTPVAEALENGHVVVVLVNDNSDFTSTGHFIVLAGLNENGKIIVKDPNGKNYSKKVLKDGFENGFSYKMISKGFSVGWIYEVKPPREEPVIIEEPVPVEVQPTAVELVTRCVCTVNHPEDSDNKHYGMPQLKVVYDNPEQLMWTMYCASCGRGSLRKRTSPNEALSAWNAMQVELRTNSLMADLYTASAD